MYIRTCSTVYEHINEHRHFEMLYSTRHYGPMVFNFCWNKQLDELLAHLIWIWNDILNEAVDSIKIHPDCKMNSVDLTICSSEELDRNFVKFESLKAGKVNMALERLLECKQITDTIATGQGVDN